MTARKEATRDALLLGRVLLRFGEDGEAPSTVENLSAAAFGPDGALWVASDELSCGRNVLSRLTPEAPGVFGDQRQFPLEDYVGLFGNGQSEADIEGLDYACGYLWFTGSHARKRKKPKGKDPRDDLERLARVEMQPNRYLLGRVPLVEGSPRKFGPHPTQPGETLSAARLAGGQGGNALIESLREDPHLGSFLGVAADESVGAPSPMASKENGFDVEGLAVFDRRLFLGLRGPVLRGWAMLLQIEPEPAGEGLLDLAAMGEGERRYRKHFLDLDGLGVRELGRDGDDLLILAGPTMTLDGALRVYRLREAAALEDGSLSGRDDGRLTPLFEIPRSADGDHAEGLAPFTWAGLPCLFVVYDSPAEWRRIAPGAVLADVFWMRA